MFRSRPIKDLQSLVNKFYGELVRTIAINEGQNAVVKGRATCRHQRGSKFCRRGSKPLIFRSSCRGLEANFAIPLDVPSCARLSEILGAPVAADVRGGFP